MSGICLTATSVGGGVADTEFTTATAMEAIDAFARATYGRGDGGIHTTDCEGNKTPPGKRHCSAATYTQHSPIRQWQGKMNTAQPCIEI